MEKQLNKKVPAIRFKGFDKEWINKKFGECVLIQRGGSPRPIENFLTQKSEGINWIKIGDVRVGSRYITETKEKIIEDGVSKSRKVYIGDLILSNSMSFGRPYILEIDGCIHDGWLLIRNDRDVFDLEYLLQLLSSEAMLHQYRSLAAGGVVNNLNSELVQSTTVGFPEKKEQKELGRYFKKLDQTLTLHQHKHDKLVTLKQAMLQKMFPKDGALTPEVRFKGFEGSWQEKIISDICGVTSGGGTPKTSEASFWSGNIPWIQSSDISEANIYSVTPRKWINQEAIRKSATKLVSANSIAVVTRVGVGKLALVEFDYATSQDFLSLSKLNVDKHFAVAAVHLVLKSKMNETQGTSIKGLTKEELLDYRFLVPEDKSEQQKIGNYFQKLDQLISQHATQLEKLKQIKAACLERMFV